MKISMSEGPNVLGVRMGAELDLSMLDEKEAEKVRKLVESLRSVRISGSSPDLGRDIRELVIIVTEEFRFRETDVPPELVPLLDYLRKQARVVKPKK